MNKSKMIEDMETTIGEALGLTYEGESLPFSLHTRNYLAKELVNASYRKIEDDEIVVKKSEYENLRLAQYNAQNTINEIFLLSLQKIEQAKQETAREILQELFDYFKKDVDTLWIKVVELANKYGIDLE